MQNRWLHKVFAAITNFEVAPPWQRGPRRDTMIKRRHR